MEYIILQKERFKDRVIKKGHIDTLNELKLNGWTAKKVKIQKNIKKKKKL